MFQSSCEKQFHILNTNFEISIGHLRLGWKFEPSQSGWHGEHQPFRPVPNGHRPTEAGGQLQVLQCSNCQVFNSYVCSLNYTLLAITEMPNNESTGIHTLSLPPLLL